MPLSKGDTSIAFTRAPFTPSGVISILDSPSTTSATTYTVYVAQSGGGTAYVAWGSVGSRITAMEIAA